MTFIVTKNHYEYNDETFVAANVSPGEEPGVPVAVFANMSDAEKDRWAREINHWRTTDELGGYISELSEGAPDAYYAQKHNSWYDRALKEYNEKVRVYTEITGLEPEFCYEFKLPEGLTDEQIRKLINHFGGPRFYNVFEV